MLCSVAGADERTAPNLTMPQLQWLAETNFMSGLVEHLSSSHGNSDAGSNARTVLVGVARSPLSAPLLQPLLEPAFFQQLLDRAFIAPISVQVPDRASLHYSPPVQSPYMSPSAFIYTSTEQMECKILGIVENVGMKHAAVLDCRCATQGHGQLCQTDLPCPVLHFPTCIAE